MKRKREVSFAMDEDLVIHIDEEASASPSPPPKKTHFSRIIEHICPLDEKERIKWISRILIKYIFPYIVDDYNGRLEKYERIMNSKIDYQFTTAESKTGSKYCEAVRHVLACCTGYKVALNERIENYKLTCCDVFYPYLRHCYKRYSTPILSCNFAQIGDYLIMIVKNSCGTRMAEDLLATTIECGCIQKQTQLEYCALSCVRAISRAFSPLVTFGWQEVFDRIPKAELTEIQYVLLRKAGLRFLKLLVLSPKLGLNLKMKCSQTLEDTNIGSFLMERAIETQDTELIYWLYQQCSFSYLSVQRLMSLACHTKNHAIANWIYEMFEVQATSDIELYKRMNRLLSRHDYTCKEIDAHPCLLLKWPIPMDDKDDKTSIWACMKNLICESPTDETNLNFVDNMHVSLSVPTITTLNFLYSNFRMKCLPNEYQDYLLVIATKTGKTAVLQWLLKTFAVSRERVEQLKLYGSACLRIHLGLMLWMQQTYPGVNYHFSFQDIINL